MRRRCIAALVSNTPATILNRFPGHIPCRPLSEHSHQPSLPPVFCSRTVSKSPLRNANSSGDSAMLSYSARAMHCVESTVSLPRGIDILLAAPPAAPRRPPAPHHPPIRHYGPHAPARCPLLDVPLTNKKNTFPKRDFPADYSIWAVNSPSKIIDITYNRLLLIQDAETLDNK